MKHHLRNWFVAHKGNGHHPHLLRRKGIALGIASILIVQVTFNYMVAGQLHVLSYATNITSSEVIQLTNNERTSRGLGALSTNGQLNQAAMSKAEHMMANDYWAHVAPDGTQPWYFVTQAGYSYAYVGENLAKGFSTSSGTVAGWMNSSGHRANILNSNYNDIGVAVLNGTLQGSETTLVVAMYGSPSAPPPSPSVASNPDPAPAPAPSPQPTAPEPAPAPEPDPEPEEGNEPEPEEEQPPPEHLERLAGVDLSPTEFELAPASEVDYGITNALPLNATLNGAEMTTVFILSGFLTTNTMAHTTIWRKRKTRLKRAKHIWFRTHPALQALILSVPILLMLLSGLGTVL